MIQRRSFLRGALALAASRLLPGVPAPKQVTEGPKVDANGYPTTFAWTVIMIDGPFSCWALAT